VSAFCWGVFEVEFGVSTMCRNPVKVWLSSEEPGVVDEVVNENPKSASPLQTPFAIVNVPSRNGTPLPELAALGLG
jgi:hypothetical protein